MAPQEDHADVSLNMIVGLKVREAEDSYENCECDGSDCSECGDVSDDEPSPVVHEMNHKDEWKLVMRRGCASVYKNGNLIYQQKEPCRSSSSTRTTFIL